MTRRTAVLGGTGKTCPAVCHYDACGPPAGTETMRALLRRARLRA